MWPYPKVVAHRGGGSLAPENTLAAIRCGLAHGFHAIEFDVMLSRDGIPVLMHDPDFGRTVFGVGKVCDFNATELSAMDAGAWFSREFCGESVPLLEQVIAFCQQNCIWMNLEIKPSPGLDEVTGRIVAQLTRQRYAHVIAVHESDQHGLPLFSSFSFEALMAAKQVAPEIPRGYLVDVIPSDWLTRLQSLDAVALHVNHTNLSPSLAQAVKRAGYGLFCYTVNQPARAREIMAWGVDGFCTDRIDLFCTKHHAACPSEFFPHV